MLTDDTSIYRAAFQSEATGLPPTDVTILRAVLGRCETARELRIFVIAYSTAGVINTTLTEVEK